MIMIYVGDSESVSGKKSFEDGIPYETVQVMKSFDVSRIAATILVFDFYLVGCEAGFCCFAGGYSSCVICSVSSVWIVDEQYLDDENRNRVMEIRENIVQSAPRDFHAASTSGPAS
jgi:hypothetical protein